MITREILRQMDEKLETLRNLHNELRQHESSIPHAEVTELLLRIRELYEHALVLNHHNALKTMEELETSVARNYPKPELMRAQPIQVESMKPKGAVQNVNENENVKPHEAVAATTPVPEPIHKPIEQIMIDASNRVEPEKTVQPVKAKKGNVDLHEIFEEMPTLAGKFEDHETLADRMATKNSSYGIAEKLQRVPVKDLKAAIGINEKFRFINELFGGDSNTYHITIDQLNGYKSREAAMEYVNSTLVVKYNWNMSESPASILVDLVERRYM